MATLNWVLVFHIFGVVLWVGSLLLISSLMARVADEVGVARERAIVLSRRLISGSSNIGAAVAIIFGILAIAAEPGVLAQSWLHVKLALVVIMLGVHLRLYQRLGSIEDAPLTANRREFVIIHGIVSILLLAILVMVIVKPF